MAKFKLSLAELPDFKLPVKFKLANDQDVEVIFTVKHKKTSELQELLQKQDLSTKELIMAIASDWDLEEEFNEENVIEFADLFPASTVALTTAYMQALAGQRVKN